MIAVYNPLWIPFLDTDLEIKHRDFKCKYLAGFCNSFDFFLVTVYYSFLFVTTAFMKNLY